MSEGSNIAQAEPAPDARPAATSPAASAVRPPASRAQIFQASFAGAQALLTAGILVVGYYGIFYNVIPTWELKTAREELARLGRESADFKLEIEKSKGELAILGSSLANDRQALGRYQVLTRRYVIDQFTTKLVSQVQMDSHWWNLMPGTNDFFVASKLLTFTHTIGKFPLQIGDGPRSMTGRGLVLSGLEAVELNLLDDHTRTNLKEEISKLANEEPAFSRELMVQTTSMPRRRGEGDGPTSLEERTEMAERWNAELDRVAKAREDFIGGVQRLKLALLESGP